MLSRFSVSNACQFNRVARNVVIRFTSGPETIKHFGKRSIQSHAQTGWRSWEAVKKPTGITGNLYCL